MAEETKINELSAEPSTSAPSASSSSAGPGPKHRSAHGHVEGIQHGGAGRGLRAGHRRRSGSRGGAAGLSRHEATLRSVQAWVRLNPAMRYELVRLREARALVSAAIEHFADSMCGLVARLEGRNDPTADTIGKFKKTMAEEWARRRRQAEAVADAETDTEEEAHARAEMQRRQRMRLALRLEAQSAAAAARRAREAAISDEE